LRLGKRLLLLEGFDLGGGFGGFFWEFGGFGGFFETR
jgi:hypothetical protein